MRTDLDEAMDQAIAGLTAGDGPLALGSIDRFGTALPVIATAPPSLPHYFAHFCAVHADATFVVAGEERLTFAEVHEAAVAVARTLVGRYGVAKGDRVGIAMRNSPSWIVAYMGVLIAGGVATLLNGWWQSEELTAAIGEVDCRLVIADGPRAARIGDAADVVTIDDAQPLATALIPLIDADRAGDLPEMGPDDDATILFTSGSTGRSRGALSDHRAVVQATLNFLAQAMTMLGIAQAAGNAPEGQPATLLNLPLFHVTGEVPTLLQSFAMGRKLVLMTKWNAEEAMRLIEAERASYFVGVPLMSFEMATHPERHRYDLSSVTDFGAGGAPRPVEHVLRIDAAMEGSPLIGYGLTETNAIGAGNWRTNYIAKPESTGRPSAPLADLAILGPDGARLPTGETGEIAIRSVANFKGYWRDPEATAAAITPDGFFLTGDLGYLDADGYVFIVDRKKDIIIRGGENITCQEVEAALYGHPGVAEAAVFGLPDAKYGEVPGAVVYPRDGAALSVETLCDFLGEHIAAFKVPRRIWIVTAPLPRLGTEKIDRVALRKAYRAQVEVA